MTRRSKDPSGACPRCRKKIPLVPDGQGDLVLEVHHVVAIERAYGGSDVCPGTGGAAASLDDSEDWAWVKPDPQWMRDDTLRGPIRLTDAVAGVEPVAVAVNDATTAMREFSALWAAGEYAATDDPCPAASLMCQCVKAPCDGAHRCTCGHSWAAREYAG